jgi:hypothetical protein
METPRDDVSPEKDTQEEVEPKPEATAKIPEEEDKTPGTEDSDCPPSKVNRN